jgi:shikimate kinase
MDLFYANIEEIFAYDLMDVGKIEEVCGIDYLNKEEKSIVKRVCGYENTLINIDYALLNNDEILEIVKKQCLIVYLGLNQNRFEQEQKNELISANLMSINKEVFSDRDFLCRNISDITIDCKDYDIENIIKELLTKTLEYYS